MNPLKKAKRILASFRWAYAFVALALSLSAFVGCDGAIDSAYNEQLVVGAFLFAGGHVDSVVIHRTTPFGQFYDDIPYAVDSALVTIQVEGVTHTLHPLVNEHGQVMPGRYALPDSELTILGGKTYILDITAPNHQTGGTHHLHATTICPMPIHLDPRYDSLHGATLTLDTNREIDFQYILIASPQEPLAKRYMIGVLGLDTTRGKISTRLDGPPTDSTARTIYSFTQSAPAVALSPRLFRWFGPNLISFLAIDTNWTDYQRQLQQGGPSSYQPSLNHIEGGMGIFGSAGRDTISIFLKPKE